MSNHGWLHVGETVNPTAAQFMKQDALATHTSSEGLEDSWVVGSCCVQSELEVQGSWSLTSATVERTDVSTWQEVKASRHSTLDFPETFLHLSYL